MKKNNNPRAFTGTVDDLVMINGWLWERAMPPTTLENLPVNGLIVDGVAAGFIYECECNIWLIETFVSNPAARSHLRIAAINSIIQGLEKIAVAKGARLLLATTTIPTMALYAHSNGFRVDTVDRCAKVLSGLIR